MAPWRWRGAGRGRSLAWCGAWPPVTGPRRPAVEIRRGKTEGRAEDVMCGEVRTGCRGACGGDAETHAARCLGGPMSR